MGTKVDSVDLARVAPSSGDGRRLDVDVAPGKLTYGDEDYTIAGGTTPARVDVSRTTTGYALRLRFAADVSGPCVRCLEAAAQRIEVDAREVDQAGDGEAADDLRSPYVREGELDLRGWAHDALALAMPEKFLCRSDCAGLCAVCGKSLNDADPAEHRHESAPDPRWDKLRELKFD